MKSIKVAAACLLALCSAAMPQQANQDDADAFGTMPFFESAALSADGKRLIAVGAAGRGPGTVAIVMDLEGPARGKLNVIAQADGQPLRLTDCEWSAADRAVCSMWGITRNEDGPLPMARTFGVNADGSKSLLLGQPDSFRQLRARQFDGGVIDWGNGTDGKVLMSRTNVAEFSTGTRLARDEEGLSVALVDTRTGKAQSVEKARDNVTDYYSDGRGVVRLMTTAAKSDGGMLRGFFNHFYRTAADRDWKKLGDINADGDGITPLAVDPNLDAAYVLQGLDGRQALYRIALDGSLKSELVFARPDVDVEDVVRIGRSGRVIGVSWVTDRRQVEYFDPDYRKLAAALGRALPQFPLVRIISASADEKVLLVWAGSDVDPGHLYAFNRAQSKLDEVYPWRPALLRKTLSPVRSITYPAADGTQVPGYLTLPPGVNEARGLPAIVMPHGGPSARDEWGFDWLAQYFAQRGFAVLQPNFRGSGGYGDQWYVENGFRSWKLAVGDVCDAGRWLVAQGMADASKLAIFGWSYGGYAALQANVLAPDLFKAVVAVAPVTDLAQLKSQAGRFTNARLVERFVGDGPHVAEGSPARNAAAFKAPVLMFHGDLDVNVEIAQSLYMNEKLRDAGKVSELVVYPKLEHSLLDSSVRADLLRKSDAFLRRNLGLQ